eukprot:Opistho-1_new@25991
MYRDKTEYFFQFKEAFEVHDDIEILKRMGLSFGLEQRRCTDADFRTAELLIPEQLKEYLVELRQPADGANGARHPSGRPQPTWENGGALEPPPGTAAPHVLLAPVVPDGK